MLMSTEQARFGLEYILVNERHRIHQKAIFNVLNKLVIQK